MKKNDFARVFLITLTIMYVSACQRNTEVQQEALNQQQDPLAMETSVSIISDGPWPLFDEGTSGDKALREFEAATGCLIGFSKLAIDIGDVQKHDVVIAKHKAMADLNYRKQLLPLQTQRIRLVSSIDKEFSFKDTAAVALQWSPVGSLYRSEIQQAGIENLASAEVFKGSETLQNPDSKLTTINVRDWRDVLLENPDLATLWSFQLPNGEDAKASADVYQIAITQRAKHPNCSYALINFLLSPQMQGDLAKEWNTVPVVSAACYGHEGLGEEGCQENQR